MKKEEVLGEGTKPSNTDVNLIIFDTNNYSGTEVKPILPDIDILCSSEV